MAPAILTRGLTNSQPTTFPLARVTHAPEVAHWARVPHAPGCPFTAGPIRPAIYSLWVQNSTHTLTHGHGYETLPTQIPYSLGTHLVDQ